MRTIHSTDPLQPGYSYTLTAAEGKDFAQEFKPQLTPQQMLEMGVFGGNYFEGAISEYPKAWFQHAKLFTPIFEQRFLGEQVNKKRDRDAQSA
jgi:hypothetical protein